MTRGRQSESLVGALILMLGLVGGLLGYASDGDVVSLIIWTVATPFMFIALGVAFVVAVRVFDYVSIMVGRSFLAVYDRLTDYMLDLPEGEQ